MTARGRHLLRVLAVLLLVQWVAALEPCLRSLASLASAQAVELCSPSGHSRTILVDQDRKEVPQAKPHPGCPLCQHADSTNLPAPPVVRLSPMVIVTVAPVLARPAARAAAWPAPATSRATLRLIQ